MHPLGEQQYKQPWILIPSSLFLALETSIFDDVYNDIVSKLANEYLSPFQSSIHGHRLLIEWDELDTSMENTGNFQSPVHKVKNLAKKNRDIQAELNMIKRIGMDTAMPSSMYVIEDMFCF